MWRAFRALTHGNRILVSEKTANFRLIRCYSCPFFDKNLRQCNVCTCLVALKAQLATEKCPKGRWSVSALTKHRLAQCLSTVWMKLKRVSRLAQSVRPL